MQGKYIKNYRTSIIKIWQYDSPCGALLLGDYTGQLCLCDWILLLRQTLALKRVSRFFDAICTDGKTPLLERVVAQLDEYFKGVRRDFDLPLLMVGTDFQQRVWQELLQIPYGETISYLHLANHIGRPRAVRAVASACGANLMSIIIPCHRVIGNDGTVTGYAGGVDAKRFLLELEAKNSVRL